ARVKGQAWTMPRVRLALRGSLDSIPAHGMRRRPRSTAPATGSTLRRTYFPSLPSDARFPIPRGVDAAGIAATAAARARRGAACHVHVDLVRPRPLPPRTSRPGAPQRLRRLGRAPLDRDGDGGRTLRTVVVAVQVAA